MREIFQYTTAEDMESVWEGTFEEDEAIEVGDFILTHHLSKFCMKPIVQKVVERKVAYYFNGVPVYDYIIPSGSSYKSVWKHVSKYDQLVKNASMAQLVE